MYGLVLIETKRYRGIVPQTGAGEKAAFKGSEGEGQIVSLLEVLATEPDSRKRDLLAKALDLLDQTNRYKMFLLTIVSI